MTISKLFYEVQQKSVSILSHLAYGLYFIVIVIGNSIDTGSVFCSV